MPRAFSDPERDQIQTRLFEAGQDQFARLGLRRTGVADLARAAGIAKGSFYLFFPSKEALLLALLWEEQVRMRREVADAADAPQLQPRDRLERLLRLYLLGLADSLVHPALTDPQDLEALSRALPSGALARAQADEDSHFLGLLQGFQDAGELTPLEPEALVGLLRVLRAIAASREQIGHERFVKTVDVIVAAWAEYLAW